METLTPPRAGTATITATTWEIDAAHSSVGFSVKHVMIATVHGHFNDFRGTLRFDPERPTDAQVKVEIDAASIDTGIRKRDAHLRSADYLDAATYPAIAFRSTSVEPVKRFGRRSWLMAGNLTIHGVTRAVTLAVEQADTLGSEPADVVGFTATAKINRKDFGMTFNLPVEGGGLVVSDEVKIAIAIQAQRVDL